MNNHFQPSGLNNTFTYTGSCFAAYVEEMRDVIEQARQDLDEKSREIIIDANSPFEWIPQTKTAKNPQTGKFKNGILLVHGLFDSPCSMTSIAEYFRKKDYLVRSILLPGHGTVPGDLLNISYHEWIKATAFGVNSFQHKVDKLFLCGFSTGAALTLHYTLQHPHPLIRGLILFAPAIKLRRQFAVLSNINNLMSSTFGGIKWYTKTENKDYAKYQSFTFNSAHQVFLLTRANKHWHKKHPLQLPVYMIATADDEVLSSTGSMDFFSSTTHKFNRLLVYTNDKKPTTDPRIEEISSCFAEKNILNFSHVCLPIAPDHPHYGVHSDFRDFLHYQHPIGKRYKKRLQAVNNKTYLGAVTKDNLTKYHLQRLTYNPDFDNLMGKVDGFIAQL